MPGHRGRPGSKQHLLCDAGGLPLAVTLTGGCSTSPANRVGQVDDVEDPATEPVIGKAA